MRHSCELYQQALTPLPTFNKSANVNVIGKSKTLHPTFSGLKAASPLASRVAAAASKKTGSRCEVALRRALWRLGLRFRIAGADLPGRPDIVFRRHRVVVFCDGDFWHGRDLRRRRRRLARGHNSAYWIQKIRTNVTRDRRTTRELECLGWVVLRFWESDIHRDAAAIASRVAAVLVGRAHLPATS